MKFCVCEEVDTPLPTLPEIDGGGGGAVAGAAAGGSGLNPGGG